MNEANLLSADNWINLSLAIFTLLMFFATFKSAMATKQIAEDTKESRRPYIILEKVKDDDRKNYIYVESDAGIIKFPYILKNKGAAGAIDIKKNHVVFRKTNNKGIIKEELIDYYSEGETYVLSLAPNDISVTHMDHIKLDKTDSNVEEFLIEFHIGYKSDIPNDCRVFKNVTKFKLKHRYIRNNKYIFDQEKVVMPFKDDQLNQPFESEENFIKRHCLNLKKDVAVVDVITKNNSENRNSVIQNILDGLLTIPSVLNSNSTLFAALATIVIALATIKSCQIQETSKDIANKLEIIEKQNATHNEAALKAEFRSYVFIEMLSKEYDYFESNNNVFLRVPFKIVNLGKYPAIEINAEYKGPVQDSPVEPKEKFDHLLPGFGRDYVPDVNITGKEGNDKLNMALQVFYKGVLDSDTASYCSEMKINLKRKKIEENKYIFVLENSRFQLQCSE